MFIQSIHTTQYSKYHNFLFFGNFKI
jgi:hypothetical protein